METQTKDRNGSMKIFKIKSLVMLIMISAFLMMGADAQALNWHTANQTTVAWDAVTLNSDGDPIPTTDAVSYVGYLVNAATDPEKTNPVEVYSGTETQTTLTLTEEGSYYFGVKAVRNLADGTVAGESVIAWADDPAFTGAGNEFGIRFYLGPAPPTGLRPQQ